MNDDLIRKKKLAEACEDVKKEAYNGLKKFFDTLTEHRHFSDALILNLSAIEGMAQAITEATFARTPRPDVDPQIVAEMIKSFERARELVKQYSDMTKLI